ncbi:hypothetical protein GCM10010387_15330 [Streptomyces inusitatus]|uniref:Uncharacterized protein n=1 Tax=Streptomyces inusitatus TaxID=68221 RepID=A0A918UNS0_9ACTN|nr:hypothetical protein GCM10010387_15330 [Streptomyces inusitatus]
MTSTGIPWLDAVLVWGGAATILAGLGGMLWRGGRAMTRTGQMVDRFMDDWCGEPERPGVPARPGVMERVGGIEDRLSRVEHELHPNEGGSLRDAVDQMNSRLRRLCPDQPESDCPPSPSLGAD